MSCKNFCLKSICCKLICLSVGLLMPVAAWADGELDTSFDPGSGANSSVSLVALQLDGDILVGGPFTTFNETPRNYFARLNSDGSLDTAFDLGLSVGDSVWSVVAEPDGKILIGGRFTSVNSTDYNDIARLNFNGSLDTTFDPGSGAERSEGRGTIEFIALQPDNKILIVGHFTTFNGMSRNSIARLNSDGSLDMTFAPDLGGFPNNFTHNSVGAITLQPDGKILIGGEFTTVSGINRNKIARLNSDGSLDATFDPGTGANAEVVLIVLQPDGKILIGGDFNTFNGINRSAIARLNSDGSLDMTFTPGSGAYHEDYSINGGYQSLIQAIIVQPDGKILIGGWFNSFNDMPQEGIARLNSDGSLDTSFATLTRGNIFSMALQPDGKIIIAGGLYSINDTPCNRIARLINTVNSQSISVVRSFSSFCYFAGEKISVTLDASPVAGTMNYLIEDTPPSGWAVSNVSHSGAFDAATGKVKFGPFFDSTARILTYDLTPPATETGDKTFAGKAFADTSILDIAEQAVLSQCSSYHPADTDEDFSLSGGEVATYGAAWKKGTEWMLPPNPIPISYVTRAGALWKGGETYKIDLTAGEPPLCWVADSKRRSERSGMRDSESSAVREMSSDAYLMGQEFTVTISVKPSDTVQVYAMEEETPQEWTVSVSDPGFFDDVNNKVKFGPFMDNEERTLTYQITSPRGASGEFSLSGIASFDGSDLEISENSTVTIVGADINDDGKADLADVILALRISAGFDGFEVNRNEDEKIGIAEAICILQKLAM